ncbi:hypothetical protein [Nonomuraea basaltis]|uniref:hypothetical protein n=1 Tax=Nonomuraea basaltis TaxID=2495887 RepID=UPI00110C42C8|nr:hypothetical protein [Nonomuraea basaltis]TMR99737.1 hypothetical protein EJK15_05560 [Nonomuraea basaltis]
MYEPGSDRLCERCGSHVSGLPQCPLCGVPLAQPSAPGSPHGDWELEEPLRPMPVWLRPSVLIGLVTATLALALIWWPASGRPSAPGEAAEGRLGQSPILASGAPESGTPETGAPESGTLGAEETGDEWLTDPATDDMTFSRASAAHQAGKMDELLSSSSSSRADLSVAIERASRCKRGGVEDIQHITASRRDQLAAANALAVSAIPGGADLKDALVDALDASYDADAAFLSWARHHVGGKCAGPVAEDRDFKRGVDRSKAAQMAKAQFAKAWRPLAETHGLTKWKPSTI